MFDQIESLLPGATSAKLATASENLKDATSPRFAHANLSLHLDSAPGGMGTLMFMYLEPPVLPPVLLERGKTAPTLPQDLRGV